MKMSDLNNTSERLFYTVEKPLGPTSSVVRKQSPLRNIWICKRIYNIPLHSPHFSTLHPTLLPIPPLLHTHPISPSPPSPKGINPIKTPLTHPSLTMASTAQEPTHHYHFNITMTCTGCSGAIDRVLKRTDGLPLPPPPAPFLSSCPLPFSFPPPSLSPPSPSPSSLLPPQPISPP